MLFLQLDSQFAFLILNNANEMMTKNQQWKGKFFLVCD